jgi:hypothetical protein
MAPVLVDRGDAGAIRTSRELQGGLGCRGAVEGKLKAPQAHTWRGHDFCIPVRCGLRGYRRRVGGVSVIGDKPRFS